MHKEEQLSFRNVIVFNVYEFYPLSASTNSNLAYLKESFLDQVDIDPKNIYSPDGSMPKDDIFEFCRQYEQQIQNFGGIDYILSGVAAWPIVRLR